jgi:hypothetical protein
MPGPPIAGAPPTFTPRPPGTPPGPAAPPPAPSLGNWASSGVPFTKSRTNCWSSAENWVKGIVFTCPLDIFKTTPPLNRRTKSALTVLPLTSVHVRGLPSATAPFRQKTTVRHAISRHKFLCINNSLSLDPGRTSGIEGSRPAGRRTDGTGLLELAHSPLGCQTPLRAATGIPWRWPGVAPAIDCPRLNSRQDPAWCWLCLGPGPQETRVPGPPAHSRFAGRHSPG